MSDRTFPAPSTISEQAQQWLSFQAPPTQYPPTEDVDAWVAMVDQSNAYITQQFLTAELPVDVETLDIDGVTVYAIRPHGVEARDGEPIYIDIHGGGLLMGGGEACRIMSSMAALSAGMLTWGVDYRMPPLHPYPAALDDVTTVYRRVITDHDPSKVFVGGGSAGGNLAAALTLRAKDEGLPLPAALVLNTPEIDLTESGDTFQVLEGVDNVLHSLKVVNDLYAERRGPDRPVPLPDLRRRHRLPADVPAKRHPRPVPLEHRPDAPKAARRRRGRRAARLRGDAARRLRQPKPRGPRARRGAAPVPRQARRLTGQAAPGGPR